MILQIVNKDEPSSCSCAETQEVFHPGDVCSPQIAIYLENILLCKNSDTRKQKEDIGA